MEKLVIGNEDNRLRVAPHPDDECIGMGGFLELYGKQCDVWVISDGARGKNLRDHSDCITVRKKELENEMQFYNVRSYRMWGLPDGRLTNYEHYFDNISLKQYNIMFVINGADTSVDHRATFRMIMNSIKHDKNYKTTIYQYEVTYPLHKVTHYIDVSNCIEEKKQGIRYHASQLQMFDYLTTAIALNRYRATFVNKDMQYIETYLQTVIDGDKESGNSVDKELQDTRFRLYIDDLLCEALLERKGINSFFKTEKKVYLYGYGLYGQRLEKMLVQESIKINAIIDANKGDKGLFSATGISIVTIDNINCNNGLVIIAILDNIVCNNIKKNLEIRRIRNITLEQFLQTVLKK